MKHFGVLVAAILLSGCIGGTSGKPDPKARLAPDGLNTPPTQMAATGKVEIVSRNKKRSRNWRVEAESSELTYGSDSKLGGTLKNLKGELFQDDVVVSRLEADKGVAQQENDRLELTGHVIITEVKDQTKLSADKVSRLRSGIIEASGNVWVKSKDGSIGPADKIWATPDLKQIGTPDRFKVPKDPQPLTLKELNI